MVRCQCQSCHGWTQIRASNTNIHHIGDFAFADVRCKTRHGFQNIMHIMHHVMAIQHDNFRLGTSQGRVQNCPTLSGVDDITPHHGVSPALNICSLGQRVEQLHGFPGDETL